MNLLTKNIADEPRECQESRFTKYQIIATALLFLFVTIFYLPKINLYTADLGRHIKNGELVFTNSQVLYTNFYSYTNPTHPFINHHWFFGVLSFFLYRLVGFGGISLTFCFINTLTVFLFFLIAKRRAGFNLAFFGALVLLPFFTARSEIRPETLSYLFLGIYLYFLLCVKDRKSVRHLFPFLLLQLIWANTHIYFIFGLLVYFLFGPWSKRGFVLGLGMVVASTINPWFVRGFLEPLNIFKEYGYMVVENQSVFFMLKRFGYPFFYLFFVAVLLILGALGILALLKRRDSTHIRLLICFLVFSTLSLKINRVLPLWGFVSLLYLPCTLKIIRDLYFPNIRFDSNSFLIVFSGLVFLFGLIPGTIYSPFGKILGLGLLPGSLESVRFLKDNGIKGPIFNNYDIGGYLIFNLFPSEKVFVDNRPEAYPPKFFSDLYVPMQEREEVWKEKSGKYNINVIYFYRHDATPWAQPFLIERIKDPQWVPVYVDAYSIILVKNTDTNAEIINKFRLPAGTFSFE